MLNLKEFINWRNKMKPVHIIRILAGFLFLLSLFAFLGSIFLWGAGFILTFPKGIDYTFPVTDILVNAPACMIAAIGLWTLKRYGYIVSQFTAGFFVYGSVEIFVKAAAGSLPALPDIIIPQVIAVGLAAVLVFYLWRVQTIFA
jgi:hypothetical protein